MHTLIKNPDWKNLKDESVYVKQPEKDSGAPYRYTLSEITEVNVFAGTEAKYHNPKSLITFYNKVLAKNDESQRFRSSSGLHLEIGTNSYVIPEGLKLLVDQIEEAEEILEYPLNWDGDMGQPTDRETFNKAVSVLLDYALWIYDNYSEIIVPPYIDLMKDGSVSLHWETDKAQLFAIVNKAEHFAPEEEELIYFYAERIENKIPYKSAIKPDALVDEFIGIWMKENLT